LWELYLPPTQRRDTTTRKGKTHREMSQRRDRDETEMRHGEKEERDKGERQRRETEERDRGEKFTPLWVRTIAIAHLSKTDVNIPI